MDLSLGRRADYAIRCVLALAAVYEAGERRKAAAIAEEMAVPVSYVPRILAELVRAELAVSLAGREGGYRLARAPSEVSLLQVVRAVDGEVVSRDCVLNGGPCRWEDACAVHGPWARAQQALLDELDATTLAEVVAADRDLAEGRSKTSARRRAGR